MAEGFRAWIFVGGEVFSLRCLGFRVSGVALEVSG